MHQVVKYFFSSGLLLSTILFDEVCGHGRLIDPPSRSSMWRFGFKTEPNYNDNELFCGGIDVQWNQNGGRCGVCGDPYNQPQPRDNEAGGKYGLGIIVKRYKLGQVITATVDLTANHKGYFEFRLCPNNNPKKIVSQNCLDRYILPLKNSGETRYYVKDGYIGNVKVQLKLPEGLTCSQCVFQWHYRGENNWGTCEDGSQHLGCGPQETFRACADVAIEADGVPEDETFDDEAFSDEDTNDDEAFSQEDTNDDIDAYSAAPELMPYGNNCKAVESLHYMPGFDFWCQSNCALGHCPSNMCTC